MKIGFIIGPYVIEAPETISYTAGFDSIDWLIQLHFLHNNNFVDVKMQMSAQNAVNFV